MQDGLDLGRDDGAVVAFPLGDPLTVMKAHDIDTGESRRAQELIDLLRVELLDMEGVDGLIATGQPGEKVSRLGVVTTSVPPGRSTRRHSRRKRGRSQRCSITWQLATSSMLSSRAGSASRLARATAASR